MANTVSPLPFVTYREYGLKDPKSKLFDKRLDAAKNLYRRDWICHFGCVNAIEFSYDGELLISGGDDKRVMVWQFGQAIFDYGKPEAMKTGHQSNIFCLGITSNNKKIYSGGNDDMVIVHDLETKSPVEVLEHQKAVCSLAIDPFNEQVVSTAGNDGRLLLFDTRQSVHESLVIARSRKAFHGVMFHPQQVGLIVSANARDGVALWDLRAPKHAVQQYMGSNGLTQNSMSVRFNATGSHILALRRRQTPVLYRTHGPEPVAEFHHPDYYNSCTMKSCCFAGGSDQFVLSGSDDFNLYMWKVPEEANGDEPAVRSPHVVLYGHRSIVNQVRYNPKYCVIASSGVEKIIKIWSALEYPGMRGALLDGAAADHPRGMYTHEDYVEFVHHGNHSMSHNYLEQSTREDPRMMAFFDSLVQRELECLAGESDSDTLASEPRSDSDSDRRPPDYLTLTHKRVSQNVNRSQRCPNRLARLVASRYPKHVRAQKRGSSLRRNKQSRTCVAKACGRRAPPPAVRARPSAPSSERTDSDEPGALFRPPRMARPLRRRINVTRAAKRKNKPTYRKVIMNLRSNGSTTHDSSDNSGLSHFNQFEENLAVPSTSTGYRGQNNSSLFRIAEVDSDDDQSGGSRPISPRNGNIPSAVPSGLPNGSVDSHDHRFRNLRRVRRNGRTLHRSDSSESPPPKDVSDRIAAAIERLTPKVGYNRTVARLMNETNESELESSCSTDSPWAAPARARDDVTTDDVAPDDHAHKFRQRVKKARRYRTHVESDSN